MSLHNEPSITDLDQASDQMKELQFKRPDLDDKVKGLRKSIIEMKVALSELEELRDDFDRGNITDENYRVRRKKLKTDYLIARESINDISINSLLGEVQEVSEKSRLEKIRDCVNSNKEKISLLMEIGAVLVKGAIGLK
jgi:predicted nuclease with TOPRIM domain